MKREFQQYNWVDVQYYAGEIFKEYDYMYSWVQDAWNILMFNQLIIEINIAKTHLNDYEKADVILWVTALYDLYYDYQVNIGDKAAYREYERSTRNGYLVVGYNGKDLLRVLFDSGFFNECLLFFLSRYINNKLVNGVEIVLFKEWSIEKESREAIKDKPIYGDITSFFIEEIITEEIDKRRAIFKNILYSYCNNDYDKVTLFMSGYHYLKHYTDFESTVYKLANKRNELLRVHKNGKEAQFQFDRNIIVLDEEYPISLSIYFNVSSSSAEFYIDYQSDLYDWIIRGMRRLC